MDAGKNNRRRYSDDQRVEALRLYVEVGPAQAGRRLDIPAATIRKWAERSDVPLRQERTCVAAAAVEGARLTWAQRRADVAQRSGYAAACFLERAIEAGPRAAADLMRAFKIAVDSAQLLGSGPPDEEVDQQKVDDELKDLLGTLHREAVERSEQLAREGDPAAVAAAIRTAEREVKGLTDGGARVELLALLTSLRTRRTGRMDLAENRRDHRSGGDMCVNGAAKAP
jgi:transposase-like protein